MIDQGMVAPWMMLLLGVVCYFGETAILGPFKTTQHLDPVMASFALVLVLRLVAGI